MQIDGEQAYPIYVFDAYWLQDPTENCPADTPEGKSKNHTNFYVMFKEEQTPEQLKAYMEDWWEHYKIKQKERAEDPDVPELGNKFPGLVEPPIMSAKLARHETWCLTWFSHYTFDVGQTDEQALASFEKFVSRMEFFNEVNGHHFGPNPENSKNYYCLMGAEDRYRWRGRRDDNPSDESVPPPCRCAGCKKRGVIRIDH